MPRAPLFALVALIALAGLALACSGTVPPPGATLSGTIYHDANANGIRDSCDRADLGHLRAWVAITPTSSGEGYRADIEDGRWQLSEVARNDYYVTVQQSNLDTQRPVTEPGQSAGRGYKVSIQGYEEIRDLNFGVGPEGFDSPSLSFVFNDDDGDGIVGNGECVISVPFAYSRSRPPGIDGGATDVTSVIPSPAPGIWRVTSPGASSLCNSGKELNVAPATAVPIGARKASGTGKVVVQVLNDLDEDGARDAGEPLIKESSVSLAARPGSCLFGQTAPDDDNGTGELTFSNLPAGEYVASVWHRESTVNSTSWSEFESGGDNLLNFELHEGETKDVLFGFHIPIPSTVRVVLVNDENGNGVGDPGDPPVDFMPVCYRSASPPAPSPGDHNSSSFGGCEQTSAGGIADIHTDSPIVVSVDPPASLEQVWVLPEEQLVNVGEGDTVSIYMLMSKR